MSAASSHPLVSVVMPAYNAEPFLADALSSLGRQTMPDWELILVDDGSTDRTPQIAQDYARRDRRLRLLGQPNAGPGAARNHALHSGNPNTPYVAFLDADDIWDDDALETLVMLLDAHPDLVAAHGHERAVGVQGKSTQERRVISTAPRRALIGGRIGVLPPDSPTTPGALAFQNCIPSNAVLARREALSQAGGFDTDRRVIEDWDLWFRLSLQTDIARTDRIVYSYREHPGGISKDVRMNPTRDLFTRRKMLRVSRADTSARAVTRMAIRHQERELWPYRLRRIASCLKHGQFDALHTQILLLRYALIM